ncbi:MAG: hypothetical protein IIT47_02880, partial [Oscillospiraceae bacterium]|nr:hypothetical protein [Oscillospiraceae bacterium]
AWPTSEIAVMGADGAVGILYAKELADPNKAQEVPAPRCATFTKTCSGRSFTISSAFRWRRAYSSSWA